MSERASMSFCHSRKENREFTFWWHLGNRSVFSFTLCWLRSFCHAEITTKESAWTLALAVPGIALWLKFDGFGLWHPKRTCVASWETPPRSFVINDDRECGISIHGWTVYLRLWAKWGEWCSADPWWVRGLSFNIPDAVLGRAQFSRETLSEAIAIQIPMPEGVYKAAAKRERCTWKRPRWFAHSRTSVSVDIPKGIPFAGKGENSWDCGDDGLFGYGVDGESIEKAIAYGVESVLTSRRRYGHASPQAVAEALS